MFRLFFKLLRSSSKPEKSYQYRRYQSTTYVSERKTVSIAEPKKKALNELAIKERINDLPKVRTVTVIDGDTVIVSNGWYDTTIRLDSIDCPENGQHWGNTAKFGLIKLIGGQNVRIEEHGVDVHGRMLATIYKYDENKKEWLNVNERMVMLGHAWVMRLFYDHLPQDRQTKLNRLENWAKSKKVGLWQDENPIPPWTWRKNADNN